MDKIIRLWNDGKRWLAEYDGPEKENIIKLMGTSFIPTAFMDQMPMEEVMRRIAELNPGYRVI